MILHNIYDCNVLEFPSNLVSMYTLFGRAYCLHVHGAPKKKAAGPYPTYKAAILLLM
jgi:hypothetical protein